MMDIRELKLEIEDLDNQIDYYKKQGKNIYALKEIQRIMQKKSRLRTKLADEIYKQYVLKK